MEKLRNRVTRERCGVEEDNMVIKIEKEMLRNIGRLYI